MNNNEELIIELDDNSVSYDLDKYNTSKYNITYNNNDNLYYIQLSTGELMPLYSPIDGSRLEPFRKGEYLISDNDLLYEIINDGEVIPLLSNTNDMLIPTPIKDVFYGKNEKGSYFYKNSKGDVIRLLNPNNGVKLFVNDNNEIVSHADNNVYKLEDGEIIILPNSK